MRLLHASTLLAAAFAVFLSSGPSPISAASPKLSSAALDAAGGFAQHGITVVKWLANTESTRVALVNYKKYEAFLKCTTDSRQHKAEYQSLKAVAAVETGEYGMFFQKVQHSFSSADGYHCLVLDLVRGHSIQEYAALMNDTEKEVFTAYFFARAYIAMQTLNNATVAHGNINPENFIVKPLGGNLAIFTLTLVGFEGSQLITRSEQESVLGARGYAPPEDYVTAIANQRARDLWMLAATTYSVLNGMPPYGFVYSKNHKALLPVTTADLKRTMVNISKTGKNTFLPIKTKNINLLNMLDILFASDPNKRLEFINLKKKDFDSVVSYQPQETLRARLKSTWTKLESMLSDKVDPEWMAEPYDLGV
ncbi:kinase-like domain-containing protein [Thamnocephalis sphaerospora]|uniref:Kinase-like domain-containing protein n=1 Tax=Thamnocephalis sphaerospora TaxID=78915 RepID=A0A4P9XJG9_9FUNG|nr:kinase-like domain-containing protein [Thamnocephalis sphaerospora]|eukprot:RKP05907.1 kinase-like domain-containing protein [Thamnocephalis sphaerospora]